MDYSKSGLPFRGVCSYDVRTIYTSETRRQTVVLTAVFQLAPQRHLNSFSEGNEHVWNRGLHRIG